MTANRTNRIDQSDAVRRLDSDTPGAGIFFARQLEHIQAELLEEKRPPLNAFRLLRTDRSVPAHVKTYTRRMLSANGQAKFIRDYSRDLPRVGVDATEESWNVRDCGNSYGYSVKEILAARATGMPLDSSMAAAAMRAVEELQNETAWYGNAAVGLYGLCNYPTFPRLVIDTAFDDTSAEDDIISALHTIANSAHQRTKGIARPTAMMMPLAAYNYIATTPRSSTSDTTILEFFLRTSPFINRIEPVHELDASGPSGEPMIACFDPSMPGVVDHVLPQLFTQMPPQSVGLEVQVPCWASSGGIASNYPLEVTLAVLPA